VLTASKGIAGGFPFAFTATTKSVSSFMKPGEHTSTFGGNPLACAAARAALEFILEENILQSTLEKGREFRKGLEQLKLEYPTIVREARGLGLMLACELKIPVREVIMKGFDHNLVLLYAGLNILRFLPPLVITDEQIQIVLKELGVIFNEIESKGLSSAGAAEGVIAG